MDVKEKKRKERESESDNKKIKIKKGLCVLVIFFYVCYWIKKNEFNLYAQKSKGQIKIILYFLWKM